MQVMDKHLQILAQQHLETKFVKARAHTSTQNLPRYEGDLVPSPPCFDIMHAT